MGEKLRKGQQKVLDDKRFSKLPDVYQDILRDTSYPVTFYAKALSYFVKCEACQADATLSTERFFWFLSQEFPLPIFSECFDLLVVQYLEHPSKIGYLDKYVSSIREFSSATVDFLWACYCTLKKPDVSVRAVSEFVGYVFGYYPKLTSSLLWFFMDGLYEGYSVRELENAAQGLFREVDGCVEAIPDVRESLEKRLFRLSDALEPYRSLLGMDEGEWCDIPGTAFDEPSFFQKMKGLGVSSGVVQFPFWSYSYNWFTLGQRGVGLRFRKSHSVSFRIEDGNCSYVTGKQECDLQVYVFVDGSVSYRWERVHPASRKRQSMLRAVPLSLKALVSYYESDDVYFERFLDLLFARFSDGMQKDLWRVVGSGMFLPPMLLSDLDGKESLAQAFTSCYPKVKGNAKKYDINLLYVCDVVSRYVDDKSKGVLAEFRDETFLQRAGITNETSFRGKCSKGVLLFLQQWYLDRFAGQTSDTKILDVVFDYRRLCRDLKQKISLRFESYQKLYDCHMDLAIVHREKCTPLVKIPKHSVFLPLRRRLPDMFEWIRCRQRLIQESVWQHNCVSSYASLINSDDCAIYSCVWENVRYTLSFFLEQDSYVLDEACGPCNSECPQEFLDYVKSFL